MDVRKKIAKFAVDFFVLGVLLFAYFFTRWSWAFLPFPRGFFENDTSIRYPYMWGSIPFLLLGMLGAAMYCVMVLITEIVRHSRGAYKDDNPTVYGSIRVPIWSRETYTYIIGYAYGVLASLIFVYMGKYAFGTLRPHFIDVCRPTIWNDSWSAQQNALGYIVRYDCRGMWWNRVMEARISFPSAHATFAMYTSIFFILYIERKAKWHVAKAMRHLFQFCTLLLAWFIGLNRMVENWSHWSDIAAGYLIGGIFAVVFFVYILKPSKPESPVNTQQPHRFQPPQFQQAVGLQQPVNGLPVIRPLTNQPVQYIIHYHQQTQPQPQPSGCPRCNTCNHSGEPNQLTNQPLS